MQVDLFSLEAHSTRTVHVTRARAVMLGHDNTHAAARKPQKRSANADTYSAIQSLAAATQLLGPRLLHGLPITPKRFLQQLRGHSFCVSFASPSQLDDAIALQDPQGMLMLDNGAFSLWRAGKGRVDREAFFTWANAAQARCPVAVAVIPDVIEGDEEQNWLEAAYAVHQFSRYTERLMFVWHMDDSIEQLKRACRLFNFVAIGSCAQYDVQKNRTAYLDRLRYASAVIDYVEQTYGRRPWIHLMRANGVIAKAVRFDSSDSSNIARNHCRTKHTEGHVFAMAKRVATPVREAVSRAKVGPAHPTSNFYDTRASAPAAVAVGVQQSLWAFG